MGSAPACLFLIKDHETDCRRVRLSFAGSNSFGTSVAVLLPHASRRQHQAMGKEGLHQVFDFSAKSGSHSVNVILADVCQ